MKDSAEVSLAERNHEVQALAAHGADQTLTERVRLRNANRRLEHHQTHGFKGPVDLFRVNRVAIVDHESVPLVARYNHPKLLDGPLRRGVFSEIPVHDPAYADVEDDEDGQPLKGGGHHDEEVAGEYGAGMIAEKRRTRLGRSATTAPGP